MKRVGVILGDGHGEDTMGKNSPVFQEKTQVGDILFEKGERFRENMFNETVANLLEEELRGRNIPTRQLAPEHEDIPLSLRRQRQHTFYTYFTKAGFLPVTISIHANGYGNGEVWNTVQGIETFYKSGCSDSQRLAQYIQQEVMNVRKRYTPYTARTDRGVKTANFYVFREYKGIVVLPESEFMTNRQTLSLLCSHRYQRLTAIAYANAIERLQGGTVFGDLREKTEKRV